MIGWHCPSDDQSMTDEFDRWLRRVFADAKAESQTGSSEPIGDMTMRITDIPKSQMTKTEWLSVVLAGLPGSREVPHGMRCPFLIRIAWEGKHIEDEWNKSDPHKFVCEAKARILEADQTGQ